MFLFADQRTDSRILLSADLSGDNRFKLQGSFQGVFMDMSSCVGVVECNINLRIWDKIQHKLPMYPSGVTSSNSL